MDVLISWSGKQSRAMATALCEWLPKVIPTIKPWMSSQDIDKGTRWSNELQKYLETAKGCIVCFTPENIHSEWVHFETGAISQAQQNPIFPVLLNIAPGDLNDSPLKQFQATTATKDDVRHLVLSINQRLETPEDPLVVRGRFDTHWESLQHALAEVTRMGIPKDVMEVIDAAEAVKAKFRRRWTTDKQAEGWEPIKQLVNDSAAEIERLRTRSGIEPRIQHHLYELRQKIASITASSRQEAHLRGDSVFDQFDKTTKAIRADYDTH